MLQLHNCVTYMNNFSLKKKCQNTDIDINICSNFYSEYDIEHKNVSLSSADLCLADGPNITGPPFCHCLALFIVNLDI